MRPERLRRRDGSVNHPEPLRLSARLNAAASFRRPTRNRRSGRRSRASSRVGMRAGCWSSRIVGTVQAPAGRLSGPRREVRRAVARIAGLQTRLKVYWTGPEGRCVKEHTAQADWEFRFSVGSRACAERYSAVARRPLRLLDMTKAVQPRWRPQPEAPDLICPECATAKDVIVVKDSTADPSLWPLWCARCGHEWTVPKPPRS
jgi:hypothetical protein